MTPCEALATFVANPESLAKYFFGPDLGGGFTPFEKYLSIGKDKKCSKPPEIFSRKQAAFQHISAIITPLIPLFGNKEGLIRQGQPVLVGTQEICIQHVSQRC